MRLIDADELRIDYLVGSTSTNTECYRYISKKQIDDAPTVDAEPVRHGKWLLDENGHFHCSECDKIPINRIEMQGVKIWEIVNIGEYMKYCPRCGAKMIHDDGSYTIATYNGDRQLKIKVKKENKAIAFINHIFKRDKT